MKILVPIFLLLLALPAGAEVQFAIGTDAKGKALAAGDTAIVEVRVVSDERVTEPELVFEGGKLDLVRGGTTRQSSFGFGRRSRYDVTYQFGVSGQPGSYSIKATVKNGAGESYESESVPLKVRPPTAAELAVEPALLLRTSRDTYYVGEPFDLELFVLVKPDTTLRLERGSSPQISGENMEIELDPQPAEGGKIDGYDTARWTARVTPRKVGPVNLTAKFRTLMSVRTSTGRMGNRHFPIESPALPLSIERLPTKDQPDDFTGTVGNFQMTCAADPLSVDVGEPISLRLSITGTGNFDSITPPKPADSAGWKFYQTSRMDIQKSDSGPDKLEFVLSVVPQTVKAAIPSFRLPVFDPDTKKYTTLFTAPIPITVKGMSGANAPASPSTTTTPSSSAAPSDTSNTPPPIAELKDILLTSGATAPTWATASAPAWRKPGFWWLNGGLAAALIGLAMFARLRGNAPRTPARPGFDELLKATESAPKEAKGFYAAAMRCLDNWLDRGCDLTDPAPALVALRQKHDYLQFGAPEDAAAKPVSEDERREVIDALRSLQS